MSHKITRQEDKVLVYNHGAFGGRGVYRNLYRADEFKRKFHKSAAFKAQHTPISPINGIRMEAWGEKFRPHSKFYHHSAHFSYSCESLEHAINDGARILIDIDPSMTKEQAQENPVHVGKTSSISEFVRNTSFKYAVINIRSLDELENLPDETLPLLENGQERLSICFMGKVSKFEQQNPNGTLFNPNGLKLHVPSPQPKNLQGNQRPLQPEINTQMELDIAS